jgi:uncharacterized protein (TIGR03083 family)
MTQDTERLAGYVEAWRLAVADTVALLRSLDDEAWGRPTDLAGWDVRAVAAHLAHLESELAGNPQRPVEVPELEHIASAMGRYTEMGPIARAGWSTTQIVDELEQAASVRLAQLRAAPPTDGRAAPAITPGGIGWDTETLLSNRPIDVWMHQQDVRRAVGRAGGLDAPAAAHTVRVFARGFGFVVGKRVAPPAGTTAVLDVTGPQQAHAAVLVDDDGRAQPVHSDPVGANVTLRMGTEAFVLLAGGRRAPSVVPVEVLGDRELGDRILAAMAVTP